jgi:predicted HTH domain antitoxin
MSQMAVNLEVPKFLMGAVDVDKKDLGNYIRQTLAVELYREGRLSLGKAKELANLDNKWEMIQLLNLRGVALDYSAMDAENDLETLDSILLH